MTEPTSDAYATKTNSSPRVSDDLLSLEADVLVIGGGPAGTWSAWSAAAQGANVVLVDKGYCVTSGATAPSGVGVWYVPPDPTLRAEARASRDAMGGHLADRAWMDRVLDQTYENVGKLADWVTRSRSTTRANPRGAACKDRNT